MPSYTHSVRTAISFSRLVALSICFFMLPVYGLGLGKDLPSNEISFVTILDDWYNLRGTQTTPPEVKPWLFTAYGLAVAADVIAIVMSRSGSPFRAVGRVADAAAGITVAICAENILNHVVTNQSANPAALQTAELGSFSSTVMALILIPNAIEAIAVAGVLTPKGD